MHKSTVQEEISKNLKLILTDVYKNSISIKCDNIKAEFPELDEALVFYEHLHSPLAPVLDKSKASGGHIKRHGRVSLVK